MVPTITESVNAEIKKQREIEFEMQDVLFEKVYDFLKDESYVDYYDDILKSESWFGFDFDLNFSNKNGEDKTFSFETAFDLECSEDDLEFLKNAKLSFETALAQENQFVVKVAE